MNQLNERLAIVKRQKKIYMKKLNETKEPQEQYDLSKKIMKLDEEESELLTQLGVEI